ncbi:MAG: hypothetical protein J6T10_19310 [Methanobrevibacter sp.]|nr:hypothetical protein [Methanobrevibacter sp.]
MKPGLEFITLKKSLEDYLLNLGYTIIKNGDYINYDLGELELFSFQLNYQYFWYRTTINGNWQHYYNFNSEIVDDIKNYALKLAKDYKHYKVKLAKKFMEKDFK